jgi:hypothetical protein
MGDNTYVDLQVLAEIDNDEYLVRISKADLNALVAFDDRLVVRHWDGNKPLMLETYGKSTVRTQGDADKSNNLVQLPRLHGEALGKLISS